MAEPLSHSSLRGPLCLSDTRTNERTTMLAARLDPQMEEELEKLAAATGRSKGFYVKQALAAYLEDRADYFVGACCLGARRAAHQLGGTEARAWPGALNSTRRPSANWPNWTSNGWPPSSITLKIGLQPSTIRAIAASRSWAIKRGSGAIASETTAICSDIGQIHDGPSVHSMRD